MRIFITCFSLCVSFNAYAQNAISKVSYICTTKILKGKSHDGLNTLYFDQKRSLYIHNDWPEKDSFSLLENTGHVIKGDKEGMPVFIDMAEKSMWYKSDYSAGQFLFIFKDTLPAINWQIKKDTCNIGGMHCVKAIGYFGGRIYEVWFTPDIPVSLGPYKLGGLPGLILEAKSQDGCVAYKFRFFEFETGDKIMLERPRQGKVISWEAFRKYIIDKLHYTEALSTDEATITNNDPPADYEIEKSKFTIISAYKKARKKK
jgi:GLPGLI family protein